MHACTVKGSLAGGLFPLHKPMQTAAFAIHGLTIGGPLAHLWYAAVNRLVGRGGGLLRLLTKLALDRVFYDSLQARTPPSPA